MRILAIFEKESDTSSFRTLSYNVANSVFLIYPYLSHL